MKPVCLVIGAGAGIGGTVGKRFAREGFHAVLCRRTDEAGLATLVGDIEGAGGTASGFLMNAVAEGTIEERVAATEAEIGPIEVAGSISAPRSAIAALGTPASRRSRWVGGWRHSRSFGWRRR